MSASVRVFFYFVLCWLSGGALVRAGMPNGRAFNHKTQNFPQWLKHHRFQKFNPQEYVGDMREEVPTFFHRRNKDGKILNALVEDTWFKLCTSAEGKKDQALKQ
jgi:hypothetical protein